MIQMKIRELRRCANTPEYDPRKGDFVSNEDDSTLFPGGIHRPHHKKLTEREVAWLAGWLEGEGNFQSRPSGHNSWSIRGTSTDKDVVENVRHIAGVGRVHLVKTANPKHKDVYFWEVNRRCDVAPLLRRLLPHMHSRRRARITEMLGEMDQAVANRKYVQLTDAALDELRRIYATGKYSQKALAAWFGVHEATVSRILSGKIRKKGGDRP